MSAHPDVREQLERIKSITRRQGYESERGLQLESAGFKTLGGLLDMFASAGMTDTPNREEHKLRDVAMDPIPEARRQALEALYQRVEVRAADISGTHAWWPCRRGCDHCCRHLSAPLPLTELEWRYLWDGFQRLPAQAQAEVRARVAELERSGASRPYTCSLLDRETGACRVYAHRPLACRSYGFAAARDGGRWCHFITDLLVKHGDGDIVWANQDSLEDAVASLGGPVSTLFEWFAAHR